MKISIDRETLLKPLQLVSGVVERRQSIPVLANALLKSDKKSFTLTGTDLEIELQGRIALEKISEAGEITVPARKLIDICKTLPEKAQIDLNFDGQKVIVRSGKSRFSLATLPADEFPKTEEFSATLEFKIPATDLRSVIEKTSFAMAQQDVRYYLNGLLFEVSDNQLVAVATDGHRMGYSSIEAKAPGMAQVIVPRKAVLELSRLLADTAGEVDVLFGSNQLQVKTDHYVFTTKLIEGRFPDYSKVIPTGGDKVLIVDRDILKQALNRVAVLANEKHRGVLFELQAGTLRITANNTEQEEAEEELNVNYHGGEMNISFNVTYLFDVINALNAGNMQFTFTNSDSSIRVEQEKSAENNNADVYVIMPMQL